MTSVDVAILAVLAVLLLKGVWLGLIHELCGIAGLAVGSALAVRYHASLAEAVPGSLGIPPWLANAACFTLLLVAALIFFGLFGLVLSRLIRLVFLGGFNRVLGGLFGMVQGVLLLALLLYGFSLTNWLKEERAAARLAPPFVALGEQMVAGGRQLLQ